VAVLSVKAPTAVFKDADVSVEARFKVTGMPAQDLLVELYRAGEEQPLDKRLIKHDGAQTAYAEGFTARMDKVGTQTLTVSVKPTQAETREIRTDNNSQSVKVNVADDKAKVLLIESEPRWEFHYLASALARDRAMQVTSVVFHQPRLGKVAEEELQRAGNPGLTLPTEPDALASYDCIILGDVIPEDLPPADRVRLENYVAERGGTLVVLAGKQAMPLAYTSGGADDPLVKLLPIEQPRSVPVDADRGFAVTLTPEGTLSPFLQMEPERSKSEERWRSLPHHFWGVIGKAKPGAAVLGCLKEDRPFGALANDAALREKEQALIARQHYGFGRVLFVGLDSTWRWRYKVGDTYHHRFWGQVIRWAATDKPLVSGNDIVRFGTTEPVYQQDQEVSIVVRLADEAPKLRPDALAAARILRVQPGKPDAQEAVALVPLTRRPAQPRVFDGKVRDLPGGEYVVELAIPDLADRLIGPVGPDGKPATPRATFRVNATTSEETADLACNWPLLEELAAKSGGKFFTADNAGELAELLISRSVSRVERPENRLWQWWVTLAVLVGLLTVEWVGRKLAGLP
jgi:hypothetical protein